MKKIIGFIQGLFLLTGCASAPVVTVEDQAKLIEYENCIQIISGGRITPYNYYDFILADCAKYRP
jgi:uncharacterized protein YcfL